MNTTQSGPEAVEAPRHIRASVGPKVLSRSAELFDQRLETILNELLQNSRRAGAQHVAISVTPIAKDRSAISIADNGCGIETPEKLITFGDSDWDMETDEIERAAGMGFYSLASRGCAVHSLDWKATISPDAFVGKESVLVQRAERIVGTTVSFDADRPVERVLNLIADHARHYPFTLTLNGNNAPQIDFLEGAVHVKEAYGVRIGVFFDKDHRYSPATSRLNFHGLVLAGPTLPTVCYVESSGVFHVKLDVVDARGFKLVLPARNAVIEDEYVKKVSAAARIAILEHCAKDPTHRLAYREYRDALDAGLKLAPPTILLKPWEPEEADGDPTEPFQSWSELPVIANNSERIVLIAEDNDDAELNINLQRAFAMSASRSGLLVAKSNDRYEGYAEYDALAKYGKLTLTVASEGVEHAFDPSETPPEALAKSLVVPSIIVHLGLCRKNGGDFTIDLEADLWCTNPECSEPAEAIVFVRSEITAGDLADHLMKCYFTYDDDGDRDAYDVQREGAYTNCHEAALALLSSKKDADAYRAFDDAEKLRWLGATIARVDASRKGRVVHFTDGTVARQGSSREEEGEFPPAIWLKSYGDGPVFSTDEEAAHAIRSQNDLDVAFAAFGFERREVQVHVYDTGADRDHAMHTLAAVCSIPMQTLNLDGCFMLILMLPDGDGALHYHRHQQFVEVAA